MGRSSERHEVLEIWRRYYIGGQLQLGDEVIALFHESITIFPTMCSRAGQSNNFLWSDHKDEKIPTNSLTLWICQLVTTASSCYVFRLTTDHNYAYTSTHYPVTTTATSVQLVTGNCSYPLQLLTSSCSLNSTEHISRSRKDKDSDHIFDDQNKLTYAIPFKDNVYGFGDDGLRSITANCRGFCQFRWSKCRKI